MLILASILLVGFVAAGVYLYAFRTIPLSSDPVTWIDVFSVHLGSAKTNLPIGWPTSSGYLQAEYRFNKDLPIVPRPSKVTGCVPAAFWCTDLDTVPSRWDVSPVVKQSSPTGLTQTSYAVDLDLDDDATGMPDVGVIITFKGSVPAGENHYLYYYDVRTFVSAKNSGLQDSTNEYYWWWEGTYFEIHFTSWYRLLRVSVNGEDSIKPGDKCLNTGECNWVLMVPAKSPSEPLSSQLSLLEKIFPWTAGQKTITNVYDIVLDVDTSIVLGTAQTTLYVPGPTLTSPFTTLTVPNPMTVFITERVTVTKTYSYFSVRYEYVTVENGVTRTVTSWGTVRTTITQTMGGGTVTSIVVKPGETVTKTVVVERTVTATPTVPGPPTDICSLWPELCQIAPPAVLVLIVAIVVMVIVLAIISAASARSRPPSRGRGRRA
jgi:hypothetical protein